MFEARIFFFILQSKQLDDKENVRILLSSIKPASRDLQKWKTMLHFTQVLLTGYCVCYCFK